MKTACLLRAVACSLALGIPALPVHAGAHVDHQASPALLDLARQVIASDPRVGAAQAALDAAVARFGGAASPLYNPELELDHESGPSRTTTVGFRQTVDFSDKAGARREVSRHEQAAVAAEVEAAAQEVAGELLAGLAGHHTARALAELAGQRVQVMERLREAAEKRAGAGDLGQVDLEFARLAVSEARLLRAEALAELADAGQLLIGLLGEGRDAWPALPASPPRPAGSAAAWDGLPSLRAREQRVAALRSTVGLRARETRPDPTVALRAGREDDETIAGLTLSIPLHLRNDFTSEVTAAGADLLQAERTLESARRQARTRHAAAVAKYRQLLDAWSEWEHSGAQGIERQTELLMRAWHAGELSTTDYLMQVRQALDTRGGALELRGKLWRAWVEWLVASGDLGPWLGLRAEEGRAQ